MSTLDFCIYEIGRLINQGDMIEARRIANVYGRNLGLEGQKLIDKARESYESNRDE